jgi:hypothetical protein
VSSGEPVTGEDRFDSGRTGLVGVVSLLSIAPAPAQLPHTRATPHHAQFEAPKNSLIDEEMVH